MNTTTILLLKYFYLPINIAVFSGLDNEEEYKKSCLKGIFHLHNLTYFMIFFCLQNQGQSRITIWNIMGTYMYFSQRVLKENGTSGLRSLEKKHSG